MSKLAEGRTTVVIAHRLNTITYVDQILVMKDGAIIVTRASYAPRTRGVGHHILGGRFLL